MRLLFDTFKPNKIKFLHRHLSQLQPGWHLMLGAWMPCGHSWSATVFTLTLIKLKSGEKPSVASTSFIFKKDMLPTFGKTVAVASYTLQPDRFGRELSKTGAGRSETWNLSDLHSCKASPASQTPVSFQVLAGVLNGISLVKITYDLWTCRILLRNKAVSSTEDNLIDLWVCSLSFLFFFSFF